MRTLRKNTFEVCILNVSLYFLVVILSELKSVEGRVPTAILAFI